MRTDARRTARPARHAGVTQADDAGPSGVAPRSRREDIIEAAAECFSVAGYDATAMRDIARKTGMLAGSIYYHFASKEEILIAVHEEAVRRIMNHVCAGIDPSASPWDRLLQASANYAEVLVAERKFAEVVVTEFPRRRDDALRAVLVSHRNAFEKVFRDIVDDLPLAPWVDRTLWRLALLSQLAWSVVWYRSKGGKTPAEIAVHMVDLLRRQTEAE